MTDDATHKTAMQALKAEREALMATKREGAGLLMVHTGDGKGKSTAAFGMVARARALGWGLKGRPPEKHVVVTGRNAKPELIAIADLVTEMTLVKHPFEQGIKAARGIDF